MLDSQSVSEILKFLHISLEDIEIFPLVNN